MGYKFRVRQSVNGYTHIDGDYKKMDVEQDFECNTFDDLQNIILTLVDYSVKDVKLEIHKEEVEDAVPMP